MMQGRLLLAASVFCFVLIRHSEAKDDAQLNSLFAKLGGRRGRPSSAPACDENSDGCAAREPAEEKQHSLQLTRDAPQSFEHMTMWPTRLLQGQLRERKEAVGLLAQLDAQACRAVEACLEQAHSDDKEALTTPLRRALNDDELTILWDAISRQLQQTALVNQGRRRLTINNGIYHRQPYGAWASPELDSPPHAAPLRLHLALFAGDSDINGNFIYLQDPRPQGGSVWPFWYRMGVSHAWERRAGSWLLYPAHVPRYTLPNADALPRMWIELQLDVIEGLNRGVADDASASQSERPRPQSAPPLEYAAVSVSHFSVSPELRAACLAEAYALFNHGGAGELKSNKGGWQSGVQALDAQDGESGFQHLRSALYRAIARHIAEGHEARMAEEAGDPPKGTVDSHALHRHTPILRPSQLDIHEAWVGINRAGDLNSPHTHPGSTLSGVVYLSTGHSVAPGNTSLLLVDPRPAARHIGTRLLEDGPYKRIETYDASGLLFPAYLEHFVEPHTGDSDRIILAFNVKVVHQRHGTGPLSFSIPSRHGGPALRDYS